MKILIFFVFSFLFFLSSANAAYTTFEVLTTTDVTLQRGVAGFDLNDSKNYCESAVTADTTLATDCFWFADGDVIQTYNPETGIVYLVTVAWHNYGWYRLNPLTNPTTGITDPVRNDWPIYDVLYNDLFFDSRWTKEVYYRYLAPSDGLRDYVDTYQGFRDSNCSALTTDINSPYKQYNFSNILDIPDTGADLYFESTFSDPVNISKSHCTDPTPNYGVSCKVNSTLTDAGGGFYYFNAQKSYVCNTELTNPDLNNTFNLNTPSYDFPFMPSYMRTSTITAYYPETDGTQTPYAVPAFIPEYHADSPPVVEPEPEPDTDGDGVIDSEDAFPNDPNETIDTDGDGVGDNADPNPTIPIETPDENGDPVFSDDGGQAPTGDSSLEGTGQGSASCTTPPACPVGSDPVYCSILEQTWLSGCKIEEDLTYENVITGGSSCDDPIVCQHENADCLDLKIDWQLRCETVDDFDYSAIGDGVEPLVTEYSLFDDYVEIDKSSNFGAMTCPSDYDLVTPLGTWTFTYSNLCSTVSTMSTVVLLLAGIASLRIFGTVLAT